MPRSAVSKKNKYYIPKERYYELLHFCKQYNYWRNCLQKMSYYPERTFRNFGIPASDISESTVEQLTILRDECLNKMDLIDKAAHQAILDFELGSGSEASQCEDAIRANITDDISYDILTLYEPLPVSRSQFYKIRRAFFWFLSDLRN